MQRIKQAMYEQARQAEEKAAFNTGEFTLGRHSAYHEAAPCLPVATPVTHPPTRQPIRAQPTTSTSPHTKNNAILVNDTEGEAALEEVPKDMDSARAGGLALGTLSRLLTTLDLLYTGGEGGRLAVGDYRMAVQKSVQHGGEGRGGGRCVGLGGSVSRLGLRWLVGWV